MSSISSHVPLKHWSSGLSFNWKRTVLLIEAPIAKMGFALQNSQYPGTAPRQKLPLCTGPAGLGFQRAGSHLPSDTGAQCFPSYGKEPSLLHRHPWLILVKFPQKFLSTRVSPGQKLPGQTALAGLGLLRASSHLPSKHCGSMLFFLWNWPSPPGQNG